MSRGRQPPDNGEDGGEESGGLRPRLAQNNAKNNAKNNVGKRLPQFVKVAEKLCKELAARDERIAEVTVFASYLIRLRCSDRLLPDFLSHFLNSASYWRQVVKLSYGTAQPGANASVLSKLVVPLPPIDEQRAIARILDPADVAIERTCEVIAKAQRLKRGLMQNVLTGRVRVGQESARPGHQPPD